MCTRQAFYLPKKKAVRISTFSPYRCHSLQLFKDCNIMPLKQINDLQLACFIYRCVYIIMPSDFCKMFTVDSKFHSHDTRIKNYLHQDCRKLMLRSNTVPIAGVLLWNSLSDELSDASTYVIFKNVNRRYLIDHL